jgi:hypothetical protein
MKRAICGLNAKGNKKKRVVDGCFWFLVAMSVCLFDVGNSVEGVCGVLCVSNVQRGRGSQT